MRLQCGGFLSDKWLGKPEPGLYDQSITPSQRKVSTECSRQIPECLELVLTQPDNQYHGVIQAWGDWSLFQKLLVILSKIAHKHSSEDVKMSISNVATRWVLDFPYVGAVIVGARMGISEHTADNAASFGWSLDEEDRAAVEKILSKSRREAMFEAMGDCGGEYR
jgi:hypothetical protein